jgi:hypothetical protein
MPIGIRRQAIEPLGSTTAPRLADSNETGISIRVEWNGSFRLFDRAAAPANLSMGPAAWLPWNYRETLAKVAE